MVINISVITTVLLICAHWPDLSALNFHFLASEHTHTHTHICIHANSFTVFLLPRWKINYSVIIFSMSIPTFMLYMYKTTKSPVSMHHSFSCTQVLSCYETGLPYCLDPSTLNTLGEDDLGGHIKLKALAAHFRLDMMKKVSTTALITIFISYKPL